MKLRASFLEHWKIRIEPKKICPSNFLAITNPRGLIFASLSPFVCLVSRRGGGNRGGKRRCFKERLRLLPFCTPTMCITLIWSRQGGHRVEDTTFLHPGCVSSLWIGRYNVDGSTRNPVRKPVEGQVV